LGTLKNIHNPKATERVITGTGGGGNQLFQVLRLNIASGNRGVLSYVRQKFLGEEESELEKRKGKAYD